METKLLFLDLLYPSPSGKDIPITISYQLFGQKLFSAPIVLVNHAFTGNSDVASEQGWWQKLVGDSKAIDTQKYTILCFDVPGNGYQNLKYTFSDELTILEVAQIFNIALKTLKINVIDLIIGGSIGGSIGWQMLALEPHLAKKFIPIGTDYKTSVWLYAQCLVQEVLLSSTTNPLGNARIHAMLCYRTPESINARFQNQYNAVGLRKAEEWLDFHAQALEKRFSLEAYQMMNRLLMNINVDLESIKKIVSEIHLVAINSDLFFPALETQKSYQVLKSHCTIQYHEIQSIHGHDAFLMEYEQMTNIVKKALFTE